MFLASTTADAAGTLNSGYLIDGNVPDSTSISSFADPSGATAELGPLNQNTTKLGVINTDPLPSLGYTSITPGNDLSKVWLETNVSPETGHVWLYFAFERLAASTGVVAFEFEKNGAPAACNYAGVNLTDPPGATNTATQDLIANCNPFASRSPGDFLLVFDLQGQNLVIVKRTFLGNGLGFDSTTLDGTVSAAAYSGTGNQTGLRGEGVVDLTATVFPQNPSSCFSVANIIPMTITGNSDTADFKDVVLGDFSGTGISSCGSVRVTKATEPAGGTGSFPYTLARAGGSALRYPGDGGQTSLLDTLTGDGDSDLISKIRAGTNYTLSEGTLSQVWALKTISCTTDGVTYNVYPGASNFEVKPSTITECTITNKRQTGTLTLKKTVINDNGGTKQVSDFPLFMNGTEVPSGETVRFDNGIEITATETNLAGYTAGTWGGDCAANGTVTIETGVDKVCTITNDDKAPSLTLKKTVINDNGGTNEAGDWTLTAAGYDAASPDAGTYNLSESGPAGYTRTSLTCDNSTGQVTSVTLGLGEHVTCTFVNDDDAPSLTLVKRVINDNGGKAVAGDWTLTAAGYDADSPDAGTYNLSESGPAGYAQTSLTCDNATGQVTSVTLGLGEHVTCTFVNDDKAPSLTLVKEVINDNGGTAVSTDWLLTAVGYDSVSPDAGTYDLSESGPDGYTQTSLTCDNSTGQVTKVTLGLDEDVTCTFVNDDKAPKLTLVKEVINDNGGKAVAADWTLTAAGYDTASPDADTYDLSESGPAGYTQTSLTCDNATGQVTSVTLGLGEHVTCTFVNDDKAPKLTLVKEVINDNGGKAVAADWTLTAAGYDTASPDAGTYDLSESGPAGYTQTSLTCDNSTGQVTKVTLGLGEHVTCTFVNDDQAPKLTLKKTVVNDNGGTKVAGDWTLTATGYNSANPQTGTYTLSESGPTGYDLTSLTCENSTGQVTSVTLGLGEHVTCSFVNNDQAPKLTLKKTVVNDNGGTKVAGDWTLTATGYNSANPQTGTYTLSESGPVGYKQTSLTCDNSMGEVTSVTLGLGEDVTCTFVNDDQPGKIVIIKNAKPQNGTFTFNTTGSTSGPGTSWPTSFTLNGDPTGGGNTKTFTVDAGNYTVKEATQLSWILTGIGGSVDPNTPYNCVVTGPSGSTGLGNLNTQTASITVKNGDTVTCTFENTGSGATRTQGFWATHSPLANIAWNGGTAFGHTFPGVTGVTGIGDKTLCGRALTLNEVMGGFWSDIAKKTTGVKRTALDQARMQLLQQLLAAELNASAFGAVPSGGSGQFAVWEAAYCGTNTTAIKNAQQAAASFNTSGDSATFTPGTSADSKNARTIANRVFWDNLP